MLALLIDGQAPPDATRAVAAQDRGLQYGDGLFETALLTSGRVRFLGEHLQRLTDGCDRLGIAAPDPGVLVAEIEAMTTGHSEGVVKIVVTRGAAGRGYRPTPGATPTRLAMLYPLPDHGSDAGVRVRWCDTRLSRNPRLAGMKHLNRLEQVLAQAEWDDPTIGEGLMLDTEGELVCATAANLFLVRDGVLVTHDLRFCGVRGVMRAHVLRQARALGIPVSEEPVWPRDLESASELFVTNAVRGLRPIVQLDSRRWTAGPVLEKLATVPYVMRRILIIASMLLLAGIAAAAGMLWWADRWLDTPIVALDKSTVVDVPAGSTLRAVATRLEQQGLVDQPRIWIWWARLSKLEGGLKAGEYQLEAGLTPRTLLTRLSSGQVVLHGITFIEGSTFADMRKALEAHSAVRNEYSGRSSERHHAGARRARPAPRGAVFSGHVSLRPRHDRSRTARAGSSKDDE